MTNSFEVFWRRYLWFPLFVLIQSSKLWDSGHGFNVSKPHSALWVLGLSLIGLARVYKVFVQSSVPVRLADFQARSFLSQLSFLGIIQPVLIYIKYDTDISSNQFTLSWNTDIKSSKKSNESWAVYLESNRIEWSTTSTLRTNLISSTSWNIYQIK